MRFAPGPRPPRPGRRGGPSSSSAETRPRPTRRDPRGSSGRRPAGSPTQRWATWCRTVNGGSVEADRDLAVGRRLAVRAAGGHRLGDDQRARGAGTGCRTPPPAGEAPRPPARAWPRPMPGRPPSGGPGDRPCRRPAATARWSVSYAGSRGGADVRQPVGRVGDRAAGQDRRVRPRPCRQRRRRRPGPRSPTGSSTRTSLCVPNPQAGKLTRCGRTRGSRGRRRQRSS